MKPKIHTLKNGTTAIFVPQKGATSMTILVLCRVGSRYETKEINGVSHFIEHLMFKGTKKRPNTEMISRELDRYGAEYNAFTGKDQTGYYIKMDAAKTTLAVDMLYDMLFHSAYDQKEIDRERGVIIEEINMYEDNPRMHIDDMLEGVMFPDSTMGWNIAGPREVIRRVKRDELIAYRDAYYVPERMTVIVAGKIQSGLHALLQKTFGSVKRPSKHDHAFVPFTTPTHLHDAVAFQDKKTEQVQLSLGFYGLPIGDADIPTAGILSTILGGGMSSRLFIQIRERRGLCYGINASHSSHEDIGVMTISAGLDKSRFAEAVAAIKEEVVRIKQKPVTAEELRRAKDQLKGRTTLAFEDSANQAEWYGKQWMFQKKVATPEERMRQFEKVTAKQVQKLAERIFDFQRMASAVIGPFGKKETVQKLLVW